MNANRRSTIPLQHIKRYDIALPKTIHSTHRPILTAPLSQRRQSLLPTPVRTPTPPLALPSLSPSPSLLHQRRPPQWGPVQRRMSSVRAKDDRAQSSLLVQLRSTQLARGIRARASFGDVTRTLGGAVQCVFGRRGEGREGKLVLGARVCVCGWRELGVGCTNRRRCVSVVLATPGHSESYTCDSSMLII